MTTNLLQIRIVKRNNKNTAFYRSQLVDGEWSKTWFRLTIAEASQMVAEGKAVAA